MSRTSRIAFYGVPSALTAFHRLDRATTQQRLRHTDISSTLRNVGDSEREASAERYTTVLKRKRASE